VLTSLRHVLRYRGLVASLVARDLKARYRGSVLGFFWSFVNPLLLLLVYTFVFTIVLPAAHPAELQPFALFMFCGILPWTWFSSSLLESSTVLITSGNLIKKVLFPAEVLPTVTVIANFVHFALGLPVLLFFLAVEGKLAWSALLLPAPLLVQMVLTLGMALFISALTVHFRDIQNLLTHLMQLWFFGTPVLYSFEFIPPQLRAVLRFNPMTHVMKAYHDLLFDGVPRFQRGLGLAAIAALVALALGAFLFERLRDTLAEEV
jgi:lipopolysaccharide transport system permease protein